MRGFLLLSSLLLSGAASWASEAPGLFPSLEAGMAVAVQEMHDAEYWKRANAIARDAAQAFSDWQQERRGDPEAALKKFDARLIQDLEECGRLGGAACKSRIYDQWIQMVAYQDPKLAMAELQAALQAGRRASRPGENGLAVPEAMIPLAQGMLHAFQDIGQALELKFRPFDKEEEVQLRDFSGKVVLLDFWATWCAPCMKALPDLKKMYEELHPAGLEIIGVSMDKDPDALRKLLKQEEIPWSQWLALEKNAPDKSWERFDERYKILRIPRAWVFGRDGKLRRPNVPAEELKQTIQDLLKQKP